MLRRLSRLSWLSVVSVGCAVGLLTAATAVADSVLWRPFAEPAAARTVAVFARHLLLSADRDRELTSFAIFQDWRARATSFERLAGYSLATTNIAGAPAPQTVRAAQVTADFLQVLDINPAIGRGLLPQESTLDRVSECVIGDALWRSRFGGDASIVGSTVRLESVGGSGPSGTFTIVGIAPPALRYPERVDIWLPFTAPEYSLKNRSGQWFGVVGRLRDGVSLEEATAETNAVMAAVQAEHPRQQPAHDANIIPLSDVLTARYRPLIAGLALTAGVLLLVVAASAGGILAAGALREQRHDSIRLSLGARPRRLLTAAAGQGALVGIFAFLVNVPAALVLLRAFGLLSAELFDTPLAAGVGPRSLLAGFAVAVFVSCGLAVIVKTHAMRQARCTGTWPAQSGSITARATTRLRSTLIVGEIALTVMLLAAAADLLNRVTALRQIDLGLETGRLLTVRLALPSSRYAGARASQFFETLIERVRSVPAVTDVAAASDDPLFGVSANPEFTLQFENRVLAPEERTPLLVNGVTDTYFDVLSIDLVAGQTPARVTSGSGLLPAAVNQSFASRLFPGVDPIGRRFRFGGRNPPWWTIVGVVADARNDGPLAPPKPTAYLRYPDFGKSAMTLLVKTSDDVDRIVPHVRTIVADLDPDLPIGRVSVAADLVEARFASLRIGALVMSVLAAAALMLSGLGLYGVLAAAATAMRPEIGVRMALGASPRDMLRLVVGRAAVLVGLGLMFGTMCTVAAAVTVRSMVPIEIPSATHVAALISSVALVSLAALAWPAWQAMRVRPVEVLREL